MVIGEGPAVVWWGILVIALALAALFVFGVWRAAVALRRPDPARRAALAAVGISLWLAAFGLAAAMGVLARFDARPPPLAVMMVGMVGGAVTLARSRVGAMLVGGLPLWALVGFQAFRFPLELVMHQAAKFILKLKGIV